MGRRAVKFDKTCKFQERFAELCNAEEKSLQEFEGTFDATRQTISNWQTGKSTPDIYKLKTIAEYFHVSTDYLLGISDTKSPDVNLKAAVEYTGLSEVAVERLHIGIDDFVCGDVSLSDENKKANLVAASDLIQNRNYIEIVLNLSRTMKWAYVKRIVGVLCQKNYKPDDNKPDDNENESEFLYSEDEKRFVFENLIHAIRFINDSFIEPTAEEIMQMDDEELLSYLITFFLKIRDEYEIAQYHAAKAFNKYLDSIEEEYEDRANLWLEKAKTKFLEN